MLQAILFLFFAWIGFGHSCKEHTHYSVILQSEVLIKVKTVWMSWKKQDETDITFMWMTDGVEHINELVLIR